MRAVPDPADHDDAARATEREHGMDDDGRPDGAERRERTGRLRVTRLAERHPNTVSAVSTPGPEVARTLSVTATYLLSEDGRKASLLAGGEGHAVQQIAIQVPANRLHLVSVDRQGIAQLKWHPCFESEEDRGMVRVDAAPMYDAPPSIEELYRAAAKNHELESAYYAQRTAERPKRRDSERETRESAAESFADKAQRAIAHPPPSPKRCYLASERADDSCLTSRPITASRRMFRLRHIDAFVPICGAGRSAIDRIGPRSSHT